MNHSNTNDDNDSVMFRNLGDLLRWGEQEEASRPKIRPLTQQEKDELTWEHLTEREPRLLALLEDCRDVEDPGGRPFCANWVWHNTLKPRLCKLVGWEVEQWSTDPVLTSSAAYDLAYDTCYDVLPGCRDCWCFDEDEFNIAG